MAEQTKFEDCPGCGGFGQRSAMSGIHRPYYTQCDDCKGSGSVSPEKAEEIRKRHEDYLKRSRGW